VQKIRGRKANLAFHLVPALAASNRETCAGAHTRMLLAVNATIAAHPGCSPAELVTLNLIVEARNSCDEANARVGCLTEAEVIAVVS